MSTPTRDLCRRLVEVACLAPSVHNSQPWRWRIVGTDVVELWADRTRSPRPAAADHGNLAISCGAALHHAIITARALGMRADVTMVPTPSEADLLARIELVPGDSAPDAVETLDLIGRRRTDRRRFTSWPVPAERLGRLIQASRGWGAFAVPIVEAHTRHRTEGLLDRALGLGSADSEDHDANDIEGADGLLLLCTAEDDERAWLTAGEALSALWLAATRDGLSIVPLSQVIQVEETRLALRRDVLGDLAHPQLLVRVGWQEISDPLLSRTSRRPLADVLRP